MVNVRYVSVYQVINLNLAGYTLTIVIALEKSEDCFVIIAILGLGSLKMIQIDCGVQSSI